MGVKSFCVSAAAVAIFLVAGAIGAAADERPGCRVCGMYLDVYHRTVATAVNKDGVESTCGVADLLRLVDEGGGVGGFSRLTVHDFTNGREVDAQKASYVIGSEVVPDMVPNIIAFAEEEGAKKFMAEHGGEVISFGQAMNSVSPMGMTMPTRILSAVPAPAGALSFGAGPMYMKMDEVKVGSDSVDPAQFVKGKMMGPKEMETSGSMLMASYGITNRTSVSVKMRYLDKTMEMYTMGGKKVTSTSNKGVGDTELTLRHNLWRDNLYSRFLTLQAGVTLPTGDFDTAFLNQPGLQLGLGTFAVTGGLIGSMRAGDFWFHTQASYTLKPENSDDYKFGDVVTIGGAAHYTPTSDFMLGAEVDGVWTGHSEYQGTEISNSGGFRSTLAGLLYWRFLTAFGGNFNLNLSVATPLYEDMNGYAMGGGWSWKGMLSFKRRLPIFEE